MKYGLGFESFPSKQAIMQRVQSFLIPGYSLSEADEALLADLILWHPSAQEKIGVGIKGFEIRRNPRYRQTVPLYLLRLDGSETDFSYRRCLHPPSAWAIFCQAARAAIGEQIQNFKDRAIVDGKILCPITGTYHDPRDIDIDHKPPMTFEVILKDFVERGNIDIEAVEYMSHDGMIGEDFADTKLREEWIVYHKVFADLWAISKDAHQAMTRERRSIGVIP